MLLDKNISVRTNPSNHKHYKDKGYIINKCGDMIDILITDLPEKSHVRVRCQCSKCVNITEIEYHNYRRQSDNSYYVCSDCYYYKSEDTCLFKYGVTSHMKDEYFKEKVSATNLIRYGVKSALEKSEVRDKVFEYFGVDNISKLDSIKEIKKLKSLGKFKTNTPLQNEGIKSIIREKLISSGRWYEHDRSEYDGYRKIVDNITNKNKKDLFENWDGYDYYDNEYIKENLNSESNENNYPSIDHKTSVLFGYLNKIDPIEIGNINNLCITKRSINSSKFSMNEFEFLLKINKIQ